MEEKIITAIVTFIITAIISVIATLWVVGRLPDVGCIFKRRKKASRGPKSPAKKSHGNASKGRHSHNDKVDERCSNTPQIGVACSTEERDSGNATVPANNQPQGQSHLSKREQRREERKKQREQQAAKERIRNFNPKTTKPENAVYTDLTVSEGELAPWSVGWPQYYRSWEYEGRFFFEFSSEQAEAKAINNHSVIIDPFCQKSTDSVSFEEANQVVTKEYGEIDSNYTVVSKSIIILK